MLAAVAFHGALFVFFFVVRADVQSDFSTAEEREGESPILGFVDVHFGPPEIIREDGTVWKEPPERVLEVQNLNLLELHLPPECFDGRERALVPLEARLQLELNVFGRIAAAAVESSAGDACGDGFLIAIAESLWYQWLPNEEFPAPVDLVQPMRVVAAAVTARPPFGPAPPGRSGRVLPR